MIDLLKKLWQLILKNWKTTAMGAASIIVWVLANAFNIGLTTDQIQYIQMVLIGLGLFFAKDADKTGV